MKIKIAFSTALIVVLFMAGCAKLLDIKFKADFPANIPVVVSPASGINSTSNVSFSQSVTIDPTSDAEVSKYLHYIKSWTVNEITANFKNVSKPVTLVNGVLEVKNASRTATWSFNNVTINNGASLTINNDNGQMDQLGAILSDKNSFTVKLSGTTNTGGVSFTLSMVIKTTVIANPIGAK